MKSDMAHIISLYLNKYYLKKLNYKYNFKSEYNFAVLTPFI